MVNQYCTLLLLCFQALEFELNTKVSLGELTYALEQELYSVEEQNAIYQAAIATYQKEVQFLR